MDLCVARASASMVLNIQYEDFAFPKQWFQLFATSVLRNSKKCKYDFTITKINSVYQKD